MEDKRKFIEDALNHIREKLIYNKKNNLPYEEFTYEINQLQEIAIKDLKNNDELLIEIANTNQIIKDREME